MIGIPGNRVFQHLQITVVINAFPARFIARNGVRPRILWREPRMTVMCMVIRPDPIAAQSMCPSVEPGVKSLAQRTEILTPDAVGIRPDAGTAALRFTLHFRRELSVHHGENVAQVAIAVGSGRIKIHVYAQRQPSQLLQLFSDNRGIAGIGGFIGAEDNQLGPTLFLTFVIQPASGGAQLWGIQIAWDTAADHARNRGIQ